MKPGDKMAALLIVVLASFSFAGKGGDDEKEGQSAQIEWITIEEAFELNNKRRKKHHKKRKQKKKKK